MQLCHVCKVLHTQAHVVYPEEMSQALQISFGTFNVEEEDPWHPLLTELHHAVLGTVAQHASLVSELSGILLLPCSRRLLCQH